MLVPGLLCSPALFAPQVSAFVGYKLAGVPGAVAAAGGTVLPATMLMLVMVVLFFGVAFLLKYAYDHTQIPIELRLTGVALGRHAPLGPLLARSMKMSSTRDWVPILSMS